VEPEVVFNLATGEKRLATDVIKHPEWLLPGVDIPLFIERRRSPGLTLWDINQYILKNGRPLEPLPYGAMRYSCHGISTVTDQDCMSQEAKPTLRYLVLREDCHLYTKWDDPGSFLF
jgi:hypothetical protein